MRRARVLAICAVGLLCSTHTLQGQALASYRNFELGANLASISALVSMAPSDAKTIHQRPALQQDLEWRPSRWVADSTDVSTDPVEQVLFSFYNDQLFRVVVDYSRERTIGLTTADMIEAMSRTYGTPLARASRPAGRTASPLEKESGLVLARWEDANHVVVLYHTSSLYSSGFRLIVIETHLDDLARKAAIQADRLDEQEAPRREFDRQQKERDDARDAAAKARVANKEGFRP